MSEFRCDCGRVLFKGLVLFGRINMRCRDCHREKEWTFGDVLALDKLCAGVVAS